MAESVSTGAEAAELLQVLQRAYVRFLRRNKRLTPNQHQLLLEAKNLINEKNLGTRLFQRLQLRTAKQFLDAKKPVGQFELPRKIRPSQFQTVATIKPGIYQADHAVYLPSYAPHNDGNTGFIVFVENFTNKLFAYQCKDTSTESWSKAIEKFFSVNHSVASIYSDYDGVPSSDTWRQNLERKYHFQWRFLRRLPKAFLAERYVGYIKQALSISLASESQRKGVVVKRWVDMLEPVWKNYNRQKVTKTTFQRDQVTPDNFDKFLTELTGEKDPEMKFHFYKAGPFANEKWNKRLFKFDLGQKVYILKQTDPTVDIHYRRYMKPSVTGSWDTSKTYTVVGRQLRSAKNGDLLPVYSLDKFNKRHREDNHITRHYYFYENQLKAALS